MTPRPAIPSRVKRKIRRRCGFGCVVCGLPIYEYDHMVGYAQVKRHHAEELTLLCPNHHSEKTKGLLTRDEVERANRAPFNLRNGQTSPFAFRFAGEAPQIIMAGLTFTCRDRRRPTWMIPVMIYRHVPMAFTLDTSGLMLNLDARNSENERVVHIRDSELICSTSVLDAKFEGRELTIRDHADRLALRIRFEPPNRIEIDRYRISLFGITTEIIPSEIRLSGEGVPDLHLSGHGSVCANIGVLVGSAPKGLDVGIAVGGKGADAPLNRNSIRQAD